MAKTAASPRELESTLLSKAASHFQRIQDNWDEQKSDLHVALRYNRRIWAFFLSAVTDEESPLPKEIRENVANLGIFIINHQMSVHADPDPKKLTTLISINRQLALGLRAQPEAA